MKFFLAIILLTGLISCDDAPVKQTPPRPKLTMDSTGVVRQQSNPYVVVDISPMDMSYFPVDYPKLKIKPILPVARVIYSRPHKQGRKIFGLLQKYGEPWRLGANECTEIELFKPITVQNVTIPKGRYILYCIPYENRWTIAFNTNVNSWGLTLDSTKDFRRFDIPAVKKNMSVENFTLVFQAIAGGAEIVMAWDDVEARLPFQFK